MGKAGRPRKTGERYPSGDLKRDNTPKTSDLPPALLGRIKNFFVKIAKDHRVGDLPGMLLIAEQLSNTQAAAAYKLGEIYRTYHRLKALRDHAKSPNWERGYGNADLAEERMNWEQLEDYEVAIRKAEEAWRKVDEFLDPYRREGEFHQTRRLRQAVIDLCVFETLPDPGYMPQIRRVLDQLAIRWAQGWRDRPNKRRDIKLIRTTEPRAVEELAKRRRETISQPLTQVVRVLRPDLDEGGLRQVVDTFHALRAREEFRRAKLRDTRH